MTEKHPESCDGNCYDCDQDHAPEMIKVMQAMGITPEMAGRPGAQAEADIARADLAANGPSVFMSMVLDQFGLNIDDLVEAIKESKEESPDPTGLGVFNFIGPNPGEAENMLNTILGDTGLGGNPFFAFEVEETDDEADYNVSIMQEDAAGEGIIDEGDLLDFNDMMEDVAEYDAAKIVLDVSVTVKVGPGGAEDLKRAVEAAVEDLATEYNGVVLNGVAINTIEL
jgi:hypothetical protein